MAVQPLATESDLTDRGIAVPAGMSATALLSSSIDAVRDAAGCSITQDASTISIVADDPEWLDLPAGPVSAVESILVEGVAITGWSKIGDAVRMPCDWLTYPQCLPIEVSVTYTHGLTECPADIVDLVCGMVAMAVVKAGGGYGSGSRLTQFSSGGIMQSYNLATSVDSPSPFTIPDLLRQRLRQRFGTGNAAVGIRR